MVEFLVILHPDDARTDPVVAGDAIDALGGRIVQRYPPHVLICHGEPRLVDALRSLESIREVHEGRVRNVNALELDEVGLLAVQAWNLRHSAHYRADKAARPDDGKPWDFHEKLPGGDVMPVAEAKAPFPPTGLAPGASPKNTSQYLIGTVAVGIVRR